MTLGNGTVAAAALLGALSGGIATHGGRAMADPVPKAGRGQILVLPGETAAEAVSSQGIATQSAALHAAWLKNGNSEVSPQSDKPLALTSGRVLSNTLEVGNAVSYPAIQFGYTTGKPGLNKAQFVFSSAAGPRTVTVSHYQVVYTTTGTLSFEFTASLPFYLAPGTWTLTGATLFDNSGAFITYTAGKLASLFTANSFNLVNNGPVDATPPTLGVGHLRSTTISLSSVRPSLVATLPVKDSGTGLGSAIIFLQPPGQTYGRGQISTIALPMKSGTLTIRDAFSPLDPTGVWQIQQVLVCDIAGNCDTVKDPQAIFNLFGASSITVTK